MTAADKPELAPTAHEVPSSGRGDTSTVQLDKDSASMPPAASLVGAILSGRYRVEKLLGEGGMGAVYQAEHTLMRKKVAIKVLHPEMTGMHEVVARFEREAMAAAHIEHPNVATATDFGKLEDGAFFLVLELLEGKSLRAALGLGRLELGRTLHILRQTASALQRAHSLGIVHRDLKPENIMLIERDGDPDFVKVLDFGIAKVPVSTLGERSSPPDPNQPVLTQMGMVYGTPEYMAPEQALGQVVDARADLYALGIMAYEMLTGARPFDHESKVMLLGMHVTAPVPPMQERAPDADIPPEVEGLILHLLAKEPDKRTREAKEFIEGVQALTVTLATTGRIRSAHGLALTTGPTRSSLVSLVHAQGMPSPGPIPIIGTPPAAGGMDRLARRRVFLWVSVTSAVLVLMVALIVRLLQDRHEGVASGSPSGSSSAPVQAPIAVDDVRVGLELVSQKNYAAGIEKLEALDPRDRARPEVRLAIGQAYIETHRGKDAMREAKALIAADPSAAQNPKLVEDIRNTALGLSKDGIDEAFVLLENDLGAYGLDVLYEVAFGLDRQYATAAAHAKKVLSKSDIRGRASPTLLVNLDIRGAASQPCSIKKLLDRAKESGDRQTVALLKPLTATTGCGFLGRKDCYPCLHGDGALKDAIATIEARTKHK